MKIAKVNIQNADGTECLFDLIFYCPGCEYSHGLIIRDVNEAKLSEVDLKTYNENKKPKWTFNNDYEIPTFSPSVRVWKDNINNTICHLFIKEGLIIYLNDCVHTLKGKIVNMVDV